MGAERPGTLAFTFDDGPDHRTTPILLDQLDRYDVKGAFFVNASKFHPRTAGGFENQAVLRDIYRRGHFIGSHTFSHQDITKLDDQGWRTEVVQAEQVLQGITGKRPRLFRPPFGRINSDTASRLARSGYTVIMWNLDSGDWKAKTALQVLETTKRVIEENPEGGVLLFHDTNRSAVEAIPLIIEWIDERNARLMSEGKPQLKIVGLEHYIRSQRR
jgi:peptidoglycan/xylan/chitin deacetylase (PgdA/CDA1 family)